LGLLAYAFNARPGDERWTLGRISTCDFLVDLDDLGLLALHFNEEGDP